MSVKCPKCGSSDTSANKQGFSAGKAVAGAVLAGGIGVAAGAIGSKKVIITCLNCGHEFRPGESLKTHSVNPEGTNTTNAILCTCGAHCYEHAQNCYKCGRTLLMTDQRIHSAELTHEVSTGNSPHILGWIMLLVLAAGIVLSILFWK